ncbi:MAG: hypothetical protein Q9160_006508 [Pyrenula sp. 1 TL-2023]
MDAVPPCLSLTYRLPVIITLVVRIALAIPGPFFVIQGEALISERLDPILSPGGVGGHVHNVYGANKVSANWQYENMRTSTCNTMGPKADNSNYWFPALYFHNAKNNTFTLVPAMMQVYYHLDAIHGERVEFPPGFRMITGDAMFRGPSNDVGTQSSLWQCHNGVGTSAPQPDPNQHTFPTSFTTCDAYPWFSGQMWFPFCWNGNDFDPAHPTAHVVHAANGNKAEGPCPASHPKILPHLFVEVHHDISRFDGLYGPNDSPWVLAQGDPTGWGMHMDFISGWTPGVLQDAMRIVDPATNRTNCQVGNDPPGAVTYFGKENFYTDEEMAGCRIQSSVRPSEDVYGPLEGALPGCNELSFGPEPAKTPKQPCTRGATGVVGGGADPGPSSSAPEMSSLPSSSPPPPSPPSPNLNPSPNAPQPNPPQPFAPPSDQPVTDNAPGPNQDPNQTPPPPPQQQQPPISQKREQAQKANNNIIDDANNSNAIRDNRIRRRVRARGPGCSRPRDILKGTI